MNPPRPHASWNRRRRTAPPPAAAKKAERKLAEYLDGDRLAQAKAVTADKLADPETLETLDKLAEQYSEGERIPACAATDTETANATTSKLQAIEKKHTGNLSRLKKAAGAVFASRLAHTVEQGERLYSSSEGKVQDEYSRALLRASIDKRDEKAITDAMDKVNASIDAKTKADEERKAQEEAAAAAAAQEQSTPAPQQYSYMPSGSASGSGFRPDGRRIPFLRRFRRLDRWFRVSGLVGAREPGPLATARHRPEPMKGPAPCHN